MKGGALVSVRAAAAFFVVVVLAGCGGPRPLVPVFRPETTEYMFRATGRAAVEDGKEASTQGWVAAERAARVDGYRKLAEQIYGVQVESQTTVRDEVLSSDEIRTEVDAMVRGAQVVDTRRRDQLGVVEVSLELRLGREFQAFLDSLKR